MIALRYVFVSLAAILGGWMMPAAAMTVSPMQVEMTSAGNRSHARVSVVNNSTVPLPVEAVVQGLTVDENGKQKTVKAGEDFLVMPPQAMIPPGGTQNFRIQWLGDPMLAESKSFLLFLNQIPVKLPEHQSGVQVVMSMGVMINVAPVEGAPRLDVVATSIGKDKSGRRVPVVTVENVSNTHALLPKSTIKLMAGEWSATLTPNMLGDRLGIGLVQPGHRRRFTLPVEVPAGVSKVAATIEMVASRK